MNFRNSVFFLLPFLLGWTGFCNAAAGNVVFKIGNPEVLGASKETRLILKGDELAAGDTIQTMGGLVQIKFSDGSFMSLQPKTKFKIDEYEFKGTGKKTEKSKFHLSYGDIRTTTGKIAKNNPRNYAIESPVATIGVRGTKFRVVVLGGPGGLPGEVSIPSVTVVMGEDGAVDVQMPGAPPVTLTPLQASEFGGIEGISEIVETAGLDAMLQEIEANSEDGRLSSGEQVSSDGTYSNVEPPPPPPPPPPEPPVEEPPPCPPNECEGPL